jgi:hypothetical protein
MLLSPAGTWFSLRLRQLASRNAQTNAFGLQRNGERYAWPFGGQQRRKAL